MIEARCHCGAVHIHAAHAPDTVTDCACSICRRMGTLWAYYAADQVHIRGATDIYIWGRKTLQFHRCKQCGNVTHWAPVDGSVNRIGVNARLMASDVLARAQLRKITGPA